MTDGAAESLFFEGIIRSYVEENRRFLRRGWLAAQVDEKLRQPESRFVLLTASPGLGKTVFMAQLARDHPGWLRYFIRRDQRKALDGVSDKSLLLRIGYQLAARQPQLFTEEQLRMSVNQDVGKAEEGARVIAATVERLTVSPFYKSVVEIEQRVRENRGEVIGLEVEELVANVRLLSSEDLLYLALIHPARALQRLAPTQQIVVLIDALDEIESHRTPDNMLAWLANLQDDLPSNIRFVLTSRDVDGPLNTFRSNQSSRVIPLTIAETDPLVEGDVTTYVRKLAAEPALAQLLDAVEGGAAGFATRAIERTHGNLGYLDALARGIDQAHEETCSPDEPTAARGRRTLIALVNVSELPSDLQGLYAFFLGRIKDDVARERVEVTDPATGETYDKPVWPTVYSRLLGVLAVAMEALDLESLMQMSEIRTERPWVCQALGRLRPFLDASQGHYRFYHATVAEFLTTEIGSDLHVDAPRWHRRIADHYWRSRDDWSTVDNYGLAHLAAHLRDADDAERLYSLLTTAWSRVKYLRFGSASSYSADIDLALNCAVEHADLPALFKLGLSFAGVANEVPVAALETLVLLGDNQRAADYAALLPSASERLRALKSVLPLVRERSEPAEVQRLFKDQVLSLSGTGGNSTTEEIFALVGVGEIDRAHARAQAEAGDAGHLASAWLSVARAERAYGLDPQIPDNLESELDSRIALLKHGYEKAGALAIVLELILETGNLDKADAWAEKALTVALDASWSDGAAEVLSAVSQLLARAGKGSAQTATGERALRLARDLGTNGTRISSQKTIVPWLLRSGRDGDAFDLAEHVRDPRNWRPDLLVFSDTAVRAHGYAEEVIAVIARTLFADRQDAPQAMARMQGQLAARPALREWANDTRIRAMLGLNDSAGTAPLKGAADLLAELDRRFPVASPRRGYDAAEDVDAIRKFVATAISMASAGEAAAATAVTLHTLAKVRELQLRSSTSGELHCYPEGVAIELISRHEPGRAVQIANAIATCPTLDSGWRIATIARELARNGYSDAARELVDDVLSTVHTEDEKTITARARLVERLAASFSALDAVERCLRAAAAVPIDLDRFRLLTTIAEGLAARHRDEAARTVVDLALEILRKSLGSEITGGAQTAAADEGPDEIRWRDCDEWDCADWLESLARARRVLARLGADSQALRVVRWMDESLGRLSGDDYRTWAQIQVAEALGWAGHTERAVWLSTQTDWDDLESRDQILRTVAVALAQSGKEEESELVLRSMKAAAQSEARLQGAADLVAARFSTEHAIAWAKQGFSTQAVADTGGTVSAPTRQALLRLVNELSEQGQISQADDVSTWIPDPAFQAEAWVGISEALLKQGKDSDAGLYARRALEAAGTITVPRNRVAALKPIVNVCISLSGVPQAAALLRRAVRIIEAMEHQDAQAILLAQVAGVRLLNEHPPLPAIETTSPYLSLEWTCAFAEPIHFVVVPVREKPSTAAGVVQWLTAYAGSFESESSFADIATSSLDVVLNTMNGLDDQMLEQLIGSAQSLAGTAAIPNAQAKADRFVRIAVGIGSRSRRANGLTSLMSAFAKSGFVTHALNVAARAQSLITDAESSSNFVSQAVSAADRLLAAGHSGEAVRLLAFALEAAKWDKRVLFDTASDICAALVQLDRADDLWSLFAVVEPLTRNGPAVSAQA